MKKKLIDDWQRPKKKGDTWPRPKRISIYLFENQIKMLEEIAREKGMSKRHVFFEAIQTYIGFYLGPS
jgi:hypothetical protein